jgi:hypothetical protein
MSARYTADCVIRWHGVDDDTPGGHTIAIGVDAVGTAYLWLFEGPDATVEAFRGSISVPSEIQTIPVAYNRRGGFAGVATGIGKTLLRLSEAE